MERALAESEAVDDRAEKIGQELEMLRRFGPPILAPGPELEVLVTSLARYWPEVLQPS